MATLTPSPKQQFIDASGVPYSGGKLYTYAAGTTTPLTTYSDADGTPNTNPIILDTRGEASIWLSADLYKFVLKTADDVTVWTQDDIAPSISSASLVASAISANDPYAAPPRWTTVQGFIDVEATIIDSLVATNNNILKYGVSGGDNIDTAIQTAIAESLSGKVYIPLTSTPFVLTLPSSFDITVCAGDGQITWNGLLFDVGKMNSPTPPSETFEAYLSTAKGYAVAGSGMVEAAAMGDSTVDGNGSTGWVENTDPTLNHDLNSLYAWPAQLSRLINAAIDYNFTGDLSIARFMIHNAGRGGMRADDGWAYTNLEAYVLNNTFYQNSKLLFIQFGLNDSYFNAGYVTQAYISGIRKLVLKAKGYGLTPVLFTPDAIPRQRVYKMYQDVVIPLRGLAEAMGVKLVDNFAIMRQYVDHNDSSMLSELYTGDGVHPNDRGYLVKAACSFKGLCDDLIYTTDDSDGRVTLVAQDPRTNMIPLSGLTDASYSTNTVVGVWNRMGLLMKGQNATTPSGSPIMTAMVWKNSGQYDLVYRAVQILTNCAFDSGVKVAAYDLMSVGFGGYGGAYAPYLSVLNAGGHQRATTKLIEGGDIIGPLVSGLSLVQVYLPDPKSYIGYLQLQARFGQMGWNRFMDKEAPGLTLYPGAKYQDADLPPMFVTFSSVASPQFIAPEEDWYLRNVMSCGNALSASGSELRLQLSLSEACGIGVLCNYYVSSGDTVKSYSAYIIERGTGADNQKVKIRRMVDTVEATISAVSTASTQDLGDNAKIMVTVGYTATEAKIIVYDGWTTAAPVLNTYTEAFSATGTTTANKVPKTGLAYGLWAYTTVGVGDCEVSRAMLRRFV